MTEKMNTRGFFRGIIKHLFYGEPNPVNEVIAKGIEEHGKEKATVQAEGQEVWNPNNEGTSGKA